MWKHVAEFFPAELNRTHPAGWPWRRILTDAALLAAFVLTSTWLARG
jgi:hypothetical protein